MPISEKDKTFIEEVAAYFRETRTQTNPQGSIRDTAIQFGINRNKVRKILITTGDITSPITEKAKALRTQGMSITEIAQELGISVATVSMYLPYDETIKNGLDPKLHTKAVREYRAYERDRAERQVQRRNNSETKPVTSCGKAIPFEPVKNTVSEDVMFLHMELMDCYGNPIDKDIAETLKKYGNIKYGDTISRDVVVPADMPLYAAHYLIQRLFGWQNSHLHKFEMPEDIMLKLTEDKVSVWSDLVGIVFRSPIMDEEDLFWADDYESCSFKNWLAKKYTGPYQSLCMGERYEACRQDIKHFTKMNAQFMKGKETTIDDLRFMSEGRCFELLERLPLNSVMTSTPDSRTDLKMTKSKNNRKSSTDMQFLPAAFTNTINYFYDFGDGWIIRITLMDNGSEFISQGRITHDRFDKAVKKCKELYRPVTLIADGDMLLDDVGGVPGYADFLEKINPELTTLKVRERRAAENEKTELLEWATTVQAWKKLSPMI